MGKNHRKASNKKTYKRSTAKLYVKGDSSMARKEKFAETGAKAIALAFYPAYLAVTAVKKVFTKTPSSSKSNQTFKSSNTFNFNTATEKIKPFILKNKIALGTAGAVLVVSAFGINALMNLPTNQTLAEPEGQSIVVNVTPQQPEVEVDLQGDSGITALSSETTVKAPEVKVMSAASVKSYQVLSNGKPVANFRTENEANRMLEALKAEFTSDSEVEILDVYFHEKVEIAPAFLDIVSFEGYDEVQTALEYIRKGTKQEKLHKVQKGENYWVIAGYYGISPYDLEAANPDIRPEALQIGMEISLVVPKPLITVVTVENAVYSDQIAFEVEYEPTSSLYKGETKTKINGVYGERVIEAEVLRQNGRELARKVIAEEVVSEPKTKVVYQGTKDPPPRIGTGTYIHPTSRGIVSSNFGWRTLRGRSDYHTGIDVALPTGSNVKAVDGGVVTHVGYDASSLGWYVYIDHGANVSSRYLHNSKILVSRGDKVYQGQTIAYSGNTGYSTGPHLHLEIRVNGVPQNPRNYIKF